MIPLAFLVSTWFNRARLASIFGPFCLFALLLPRYLFFRTNSDQAIGLKRLSALLSPTAFAFAADSLGAFEGGNVGVSTSNLFSGPLSIGSMILFMWLDTVIYTLLAWYCDRVLPGAVGSPRELFFCFRPSYWMPQPALEHGYAGDALSEPAAASDDVEPPAVAGAPPAVRIRNLRKTFGSGKRALAAVSGLDLDLFDSTITCLLGHNGAGKARPTTFCYFLALIFLSPKFLADTPSSLPVHHYLDVDRPVARHLRRHNCLRLLRADAARIRASLPRRVSAAERALPAAHRGGAPGAVCVCVTPNGNESLS